MSTILKALKKLEQNGVPQQGTSSKEMDARQAFQRVLKPRRVGMTIMKWLMVLLCVLASASGAYLYLKNSKSVPQEKIGPIAQAARVRQGRQAAAGEPKQTSDVNAPAVSSTKVLPMPERSPIKKVPEPVPPSDSQRAVTPAAPVSRPAQRVAGRPPISGAANSATPAPAGQPERIKPEAVPAARITDPPEEAKAPGKGADRLTDGRLKVQAIVWAPASSDRMAVINDTILREGLTVGGFTVMEIKKDEVLVREGERYWTVPFGSP